MKFIYLIGLVVWLNSCGNCKDSGSCSSDTNGDTKTNDKQSTTSDKPSEIVVKDSEDLPICNSQNQNATAYRKSNGKFFICRGNGWEQLDETPTNDNENKIAELITIKSIWSEYKKIMPDENHLEYLCAAVLAVNPDFFCDKGTAP